MKSKSNRRDEHDLMDDPLAEGNARGVFAATGVLLLFGLFLVNAPWAGYHGVFLALLGLMMWVFPARTGLPRWWWAGAVLVIIAGLAPYLPVAWFPQPAWRGALAALGVPTGELVTIQWRQALEAHAILLMIPLCALWLAGHRVKTGQALPLAVAFVSAIAIYAIISKLTKLPNSGAGHFGFLPNRNHSAYVLAMGLVAGLGCVVQSLRERRWPSLTVALVAVGIIAWAIAAWSISRSGVVLSVAGAALWLPLMGWSRIGRHGRWAIALLVIAFAGAYMLTETRVKERIARTIESSSKAAAEDGEGEGALAERMVEVDFRVPTALDTLDLIKDHPWTGVGAGQFRYVFPQYRTRTATANMSDQLHPESDWLWLAAEFGLPSAALALLVVSGAFILAARRVMRGRERALRGACLAAAAVLPIHGLMDVPGHRIVLALASAWLFALALPAAGDSDNLSALRAAWWRRFRAFPILAVAGWMIWLQWASPVGALGSLVERTQKEVARSKEIDKVAREKAAASGQVFDPPESEDPLVEALENLESSIHLVPMDRSLRRSQGTVALYFDDRDDLARAAFAIERALDPFWVGCATEQAKIWAHASLDETEALWNIAMERATRLDRHAPGNPWGPGPTWDRIRQMAARSPAMKARWESWSARNPKPGSP